MAFVSNKFLYNGCASSGQLDPEDIGDEGTSFPNNVVWATEVRELRPHKIATPDVMSEMERQYYHAKQELYDSERAYLKFLLIIQHSFMGPLYKLCETDKYCNIKKAQLRQLFAEIPTIYNINKELLRELRVCESVDIPFKKMFPFLKTYAAYARSHLNILKTFNELSSNSPAFIQLITKQQAKPQCDGQTLMSLLIMPVQRITRYALPLARMRVATACEEESDVIDDVIKQLHEIAIYSQSCLRDYENQLELFRIQRSLELDTPIVIPSRRFLKEGHLYKASRTSDTHEERMFFLFNDILVHGKRRFMSMSPKYCCCVVIPLKNCRLVYSEVAGSLQINCKDKSILVTSDSYENLKEWYEEINTAINRLNLLRSTLRKESSRQHVRNFKNHLVKKFTNKFMKKSYDVADSDADHQSTSELSYSDSEMQPTLRRSQRKRKADNNGLDKQLQDALRKRRIQNGEETAEATASFADPNSFIPPKEYIPCTCAPVKKRVRSSESGSSCKGSFENLQPISRQSSFGNDRLVTKKEKDLMDLYSNGLIKTKQERLMQGVDEPDRAPRAKSQVRRVLADAQRVSVNLSEIRQYSYQEPVENIEPPSLDSSFEADPQRSQMAREKAVPWYVTEATPALYNQKQKKSGLMDTIRHGCSVM